MRRRGAALRRRGAALLALALLAATSGCATTWIASQAAGVPRIWDEHVREVAVPQPGVTERLTVTLPLELAPAAATTTAATTAPAPPAPPAPFALTCSTDQDARNIVYHQAFRYGSFWKKSTAIWFLAEGAVGTALLLASHGKIDDQVYGGYLAADAAVTGALFFLPREEIYRQDDTPVSTHVRDDCPPGLALAIDGTAYPVDAAGRLGDVGDAALDAWMKSPGAPIEVRVAGASQPLSIGPDARCEWLASHDKAACQAMTSPRQIVARIVVPPGTLISALTF
jgi:hypothetical protein